MTDDIVTRLRAVLHNDRSVELMNREAADEIERLRTERDEAEPLLDELCDRRTEATEIRHEIERLRELLGVSERFGEDTMRWAEHVRQQNAALRERVTMLVEAAAEDARRVSALEDIIAKKGPML